MPSILNTIRNISMRLYSSVEEIVTMCSVKKTWGMGALMELGSFVKISLLESSKLDL